MTVKTTISVKVAGFKSLGPSKVQQLVNMGKAAWKALDKRVHKAGIDSNGKPFPPYSDMWPRKGMLISKRGGGRWPKSPSGGKRSKRWIWYPSYRALKRAQGQKTDRMNFDLTGEMWKAGNRVVHVQNKRMGPRAVCKFKGNYQPKQDWENQLRSMHLRPNLSPTGKNTPRKRAMAKYKTPRKASPATKATAQTALRQGSKRIFFLRLAKSEQIFIRNTYWRTNLSKRIDKGWQGKWVKAA